MRPGNTGAEELMNFYVR